MEKVEEDMKAEKTWKIIRYALIPYQEMKRYERV